MTASARVARKIVGPVGSIVLACLLALSMLASGQSMAVGGVDPGLCATSHARAVDACTDCTDACSRACPAGAGCAPAVPANRIEAARTTAMIASRRAAPAIGPAVTRDDSPPLPPPID